MYVSSQADFEAFLERASNSKVLAIDTEFLREKTYYPKLCLLQLASDTEIALVDPFSVTDLHPIARLLEDENIVKLFHSGRQDLEILYREVGVIPKPIFDTQIAAALLGQAQQIGYGALVGTVCGVRLKKTDSFTDWSKRPLTESQLTYAADDVIYLPKLYKSMTKSLKSKGRLNWLDDDFKELSNPERYVIDKRMLYKRLKHLGSLSRRQMAAAREMAAWRETQAQHRDIPRKWVLTDEQIVESCKRDLKSIDDLFMTRGMRNHLSTRDARELLALIKKALAKDPSTWPESERPKKSEKNVDIPIDLMMAIVRLRAKQNDIAVPTLASHDELQRLARGHTDDLALLKGWRKELVGNELVRLIEGDLTLSLNQGELVIADSE